jgi:type II pantothenate kinase
LIQKQNPKTWRIGADVGASLAKIAFREADGSLRFALSPSTAIEHVAREVESVAPQHVALTGGGASRLAALLGLDTPPVSEFDAWGCGARELLRRQGLAEQAGQPFLLVSIGTGTSAMRVEGRTVHRVGGSSLGGGTILGLGAALTGAPDFEALCALAASGDRGNVDLRIGDIYRDGDIPLPAQATAACFGKLARAEARERASPADLALSIMGLVGENVALIVNGLAAHAHVDQVVFGGAALRGNPSLGAILRLFVAAFGRRAVLLRDGEFAGAVGALELFRRP